MESLAKGGAVSTQVDVDTVADRIAIEELINRFTDALDQKQWDLLDDFFAEDTVGEFKARDARMEPMVITGRANLIDFARGMIGSSRRS